MFIFLAYLAAAGCAVFNGFAAILEKIAANRQQKATSLHPGLLWKLRTSAPYLLGIALDLLAWGLTLFAVHSLPLFIVQPIIASSVIVTILVEHFLFKQKLTWQVLLFGVAIFAGLGLLAVTSSPEQARAVGHGVRVAIIIGPLLLTMIGSLALTQKKYAACTMAVISGFAFGGVSITGRVLQFTRPYIHIVYNPLAWAIIAYGLVGILFFTIALQRASASSVNAAMICAETILPICIGLIFLGDHPKDHLWALLILGIILTALGALFIARTDKLPKKYLNDAAKR